MISRLFCICPIVFSSLFATSALAQVDPPAAAIVIADEPKAVDPATAVPEKLAAQATVRFDGTALEDVAKWLQQETGMIVSMDRNSLNAARILPSEPIYDELNDSPAYLLLDRLRVKGIIWEVKNKQVHLTALTDEAHLSTAQYNVGDLFDKDYLAELLQATIVHTIDPKSWLESGGAGGIVVLGDVLFVRQSYANHRRVTCLLAALRNHGRRTMIDDVPVHESIRQALEKNVSVEFREKPLINVVDVLKSQSEVDIRIDERSLTAERIPIRLPLTFEMSEQRLRSVLDLMLPAYGLSWQIREGVLWITTQNSVEEQAKTCVFDVRDLCRDANETSSLQVAIQNQTDPDSWDGAPGFIEFPVPGTMVVHQTEQRLDNILTLLENYRTALRASKRRVRPDTDPKALLTRYYRMPAAVADDLEAMLPELIERESWKIVNPTAIGTIRKIKSWSNLASPKAGESGVTPVPYSVLVILQTREIHDQLPELFQRIEHGDNLMHGGGMGGGGFGGGFFSVPTR
jgi:hypothetical protein